MPFWSHFIPYINMRSLKRPRMLCWDDVGQVFKAMNLGRQWPATRWSLCKALLVVATWQLILDGWSQPESTMGWCDKGWTAHFCHSNLLSAGAMATHALTKRTSKEGKSMKKQQVWSCWPPVLHVRVRGPVRPGSPHLFNGKRLAVMPWNMAKGNCNEQHIMMLSEAQWVSCFLAHRWWSKDSKDVFGAHK